MSHPAYSKRFYAGNAATRPASGSVPTGYIWVVRSMDAVYNNPTSLELAIWIAPSTAYFWYLTMGGEVKHAHWDGRQVLNAGESIGVGGGPGMFVTISGYELGA